MKELPEILLFVAVVLVLAVMAASSLCWKVVAAVAYLACIATVVAMVWGTSGIWIGVFAATVVLLLLLAVENYVYNHAYSTDDQDMAEPRS